MKRLLALTVLCLPGASRADDAKATTNGAAPAWQSLFDGKALGSWKSAGYVGGGKVFIKDGAIVMEKGRNMTGVIYEGKGLPKIDYEITLEGKKLQGNDFFCTTTFPVGDTFCSFVVGGWGGQVIGLSSLNGMDASENETGNSFEFKQDRWYTIRIRVQKDRIQTWIDKERVVDIDTTDRKVGIRLECELCKPLGFATWNTVGAVRDIKIRPLTEAEKKAK